MTISNIKKSFKPVLKISISPQLSNYHPKILNNFSKKNLVSKTPLIKNKLVINAQSNAATAAIRNFIQNTTQPSGRGLNFPLVVGSAPILTNLLDQPLPSPAPFNASPIAPAIPTNTIPTTVVFHQTPQTMAPLAHESINAPTVAPNSETFTGPQLTSEEKPRIVSIFSQNLLNNIPQKNIIFFKGIDNRTKKATKYTILRKNLFSGGDFQKIYENAPNLIPAAAKYADILEHSPELKLANYAIEDSNINKNSVYVYKLYMEWVNLSADEMMSNLPFLPGLVDVSMFRGILP